MRLDPERASFSRVSVKVSGEQKQRYACPDFSKKPRIFISRLDVELRRRHHLEQFFGIALVEVETFRLLIVFQAGEENLNGQERT